ncbi:MAG TPA: alpha/beta fold hydrolase [Fimbriimonadaceae bacterium]|nr:alpha/beta fold hydrolase [Fimbriimonadaceae bacterium]
MTTAEHRLPGLHLTDHVFDVPLDHADSKKGTIQVFAREVVDVQQRDKDLPWLVFLQGGPGGMSPRPMGKENWIKVATKRYRLLLLDQRGTGKSTPVTHETLAKIPTPQGQADYLSLFRADSIVRDCEFIRRDLGVEKWATLGQSYGGFCTFTYLSHAPESLKHCYVTGGVPSLTHPADEVYRATYAKCARKNDRFYQRHPDDEKHVQEILGQVLDNDYELPSGAKMTVDRLRHLGHGFGFMEGFDALHWLLERAIVDGRLSHSFLKSVEDKSGFDGGPIYAILQEMCYTQGAAANWSADRIKKEFPQFEITDGRFYFMGEMTGRWMFEQIPTLRPFIEAADILESKSDWPALYDPERLKHNQVPVCCAVYHDDMYVPSQFSIETADSVPNVRAWVTNEFEHCALRTASEKVLGRLFDMMDGEILSP